MTSDEWVRRVADAADLSSRAKVFDEWAPTYDRDALAVGNANHIIGAALIARYVRPSAGSILDAGVGTGSLGEPLHSLGYRDQVGIDMSAGMLAVAHTRGIYRELRQCILGQPLPFPDATFAAIVSFATFSNGHAPPDSFDELVRVTRPAGHLIFSVGTIPWNTGGFKEKAIALESKALWERVEVVGPYRPMPLSRERIDFTSLAFVCRRCPTVMKSDNCP